MPQKNVGIDYNMKGKFKAPRKRAAKAKTMTNLVSALVKKEIHKSAEDKYVTVFQSTYPVAQLVTAGIPTMSDFKEICPIITQGSKMNQRIGNKVLPKSLVLKVTLTMTGSSTTNSSDILWGRLFVLTHKSYKDYTSLFANGNAGSLLLTDGENETYYKGYPGDENWRVNRRLWTVHHDKTFKMQRGFGLLPGAANPTPYIGDQIYTSPLCQQHFTLKVPCPKELLFENSTVASATNWAPVLGLGYNLPQQNPTVFPASGSDYRIAMSYTSHFVYEDE